MATTSGSQDHHHLNFMSASTESQNKKRTPGEKELHLEVGKHDDQRLPWDDESEEPSPVGGTAHQQRRLNTSSSSALLLLATDPLSNSRGTPSECSYGGPNDVQQQDSNAPNVGGKVQNLRLPWSPESLLASPPQLMTPAIQHGGGDNGDDDNRNNSLSNSALQDSPLDAHNDTWAPQHPHSAANDPLVVVVPPFGTVAGIEPSTPTLLTATPPTAAVSVDRPLVRQQPDLLAGSSFRGAAARLRAKGPPPTSNRPRMRLTSVGLELSRQAAMKSGTDGTCNAMPVVPERDE